ncbi:hypothetical protein ACFTAO_50845 [Paenibacillus rhizoplanae]
MGLDTMARRLFWERVRGLADQGKTILFSTHYLQEAEDIADRILLFNRGVLAADGSPDEIKARLVKKSRCPSWRPATRRCCAINCWSCQPWKAATRRMDDCM